MQGRLLIPSESKLNYHELFTFPQFLSRLVVNMILIGPGARPRGQSRHEFNTRRLVQLFLIITLMVVLVCSTKHDRHTRNHENCINE